MRRIILLDIDGVLNPSVVAGTTGSRGQPYLKLSDSRAALVLRLAALGDFAWVSTRPAEQTHELDEQLEMPGRILRVTLPGRALDETAATPKLRSVARWLDRMAATEVRYEEVIWIDDVLGEDAFAWAQETDYAALLVKISPELGLRAQDVSGIEAWCDRKSR